MQQQKTGQEWEFCLKTIYGLPASITVVKGEWKTGKTDFALHLVEELMRLNLISRAGSNIQCFKDRQCTVPDNSLVQYLDNFIALNSWMYSGFRKAFLYDEAIKHSPSRRAMAQLNTKWLEVIPELSKGRCHLIVITQEVDYTEKSFLHPTFVRAIWEKISLPQSHPQFRKMVKLNSQLLPWYPHNATFKNIPATKIVFDPYRSAKWSVNPEIDALEDLSIELRIAYDYAQGLSTDKIVDKYPEVKDRTEATRMLRKALKILMDKLQVENYKRRYKDETTFATDEKKNMENNVV